MRWNTEYPHELIGGEIHLFGKNRHKMKRFIRGYYKSYYQRQIKEMFT